MNEATLFINLYYVLGLVLSMHVNKWTHHCKVPRIPLKSEWLTERFLKLGKNYVISLFSNEQPSPLKCDQLHVCISGISTFPGNRLQPFLHVPLDKWCSVIQLSSSSVLPLPYLSFRLKEYLSRLYFGCNVLSSVSLDEDKVLWKKKAHLEVNQYGFLWITIYKWYWLNTKFNYNNCL